METRQIALLFTTAGLAVELVYEGPPAGCPNCDHPDTVGLAEAA